MLAADQLSAEGISISVIDARFCKPVDGEMLARALRPGHPVLTLEDHSLQNGFGSAVVEYAVGHRLPTAHLTRLGIPDRLIAHATRKEQLAEVRLDPRHRRQRPRRHPRSGGNAAAVFVFGGVAFDL